MKHLNQKTLTIGSSVLLCAILFASAAEKEANPEQQVTVLKAQIAAISRQNQELAEIASKASRVLEHTEQAYEAVAPGSRKKVLLLQKSACISNLKQIDGATQQWALENKKTAKDAPEAAGILPYLKGRVLPECPKGGLYSLGQTVAVSPTCSCAGHTL